MSTARHGFGWNGWGSRDRPGSTSAHEDAWVWLARELGMPSLLLTPAVPLEDVALPPSRLSDQDRRVLARIVGADHLHDDKLARVSGASGRSYRDLLLLRAGDLTEAPDAVVYPDTKEHVLMLLAYASERKIAILPPHGGHAPRREHYDGAIAIDLARMDRVTSIDPTSLVAQAQGGIERLAFDKVLAGHGLTAGYSAQPAGPSALGAWIEHPDTARYPVGDGAAHDWLLAAEVATPRGMLRESAFPTRAAEDSHSNLIVGSQGVFGILVSATVGVHRVPEAIAARAWLFRNFESGADAIREAVQSGVPAAMLRLSDVEETHFDRMFGQGGPPSDRGIDFLLAARRYSKPCRLLVQFEGTRNLVLAAKSTFGRIARVHGGSPLGRGPAERWQQHRFQARSLRDPMLDRGLGVCTLKTTCRWSDLPKLYPAVKSALEGAIQETVPRRGARGLVLCHTGDCSKTGADLHFTCMFPRALENDLAQWQAVQDAASNALVAHGGTHGGEDRPLRMSQKKEDLEIALLRGIKQMLDPQGILNPGTLIS